ncbi:CaiB/BaiF CoA transferase family protein [Janibacter limosus]|uniref:CaiB/BaiF CoA transferase family protein n=1 Tax=Janibacter limosus TaxID=53458 RepID=UPI0008360F7C|nr:CoA transferase [Janibacter limosus]
MKKPMEGVKVLEVAQFTFAPAAGAVLADWGADVVKVEHAETGDAQRGLVKVLGQEAAAGGARFFPIMEGPNRGKKSVGIALEKPEGRDLLDELIRQSDVFIVNFLPRARKKLRLDLEDIRAINPDIIYVRASGFGQRGPDRDSGGYDSSAFWARGGSAEALMKADDTEVPMMPAGAYGDNVGGQTIAGGIAAALYGRATTGETSVVDVSLIGMAAWQMSFNINLAAVSGGPLPKTNSAAPSNPLTGVVRTSDDRYIMLTMLQPGRYWPELMTNAGRPDLVEDPRFSSSEAILENNAAAKAAIDELFATKTFAEWQEILRQGNGQWAPVQDAWDLVNDPAVEANGVIVEVTDVDGNPQRLVANPVQFDETPPQLVRAPLFAEHTDEIVTGLGIDEQRLMELKIAGAIT